MIFSKHAKNKKSIRRAVMAVSVLSLTLNAPVMMGITEVKAFAEEKIKVVETTTEETCDSYPNMPGYGGNVPTNDTVDENSGMKLGAGIFEYTQKTLEASKGDELFKDIPVTEYEVRDVYENPDKLSNGSFKPLGNVTYRWKDARVDEFLGWTSNSGKLRIVEAGRATETGKDTPIKDREGNPIERLTKVYPYDNYVNLKTGVVALVNGKYIEKVEGLPAISSQAGLKILKEKPKRYFEVGTKVNDAISKNYKVNPGSTMYLAYSYKGTYITQMNNYRNQGSELLQAIISNAKTGKVLGTINSTSGFDGWYKYGAYFKIPKDVNEIQVTFKGIGKSVSEETTSGEFLPNKQTIDNDIGAYLVSDIFLSTCPEFKINAKVDNIININNENKVQDYTIEVENIGRQYPSKYYIITTLPENVKVAGNLPSGIEESIVDGKTVLTKLVKRSRKNPLGYGAKALYTLKLTVEGNLQANQKIESKVKWLLNKDDIFLKKTTAKSFKHDRLEHGWGGDSIIDYYTYDGQNVGIDYNVLTISSPCSNIVEINVDTKNPNIATPDQFIEVGKELNAKFEYNDGIDYNLDDVDKLAWNDNAPEDKKPVTIEVEGLPDGIKFDQATKTFTGIPKVSGLTEITVKATDDAGNITTKKMKLYILESPTKVIADITALTEDEERTKLEEKIVADVKAKNPNLPKDVVVTVDLEKGTVEVKDGDKVIGNFDNVIEKLKAPAKTIVKNLDKLEANEVDSIKKAIIAKNKGIKPEQIEVVTETKNGVKAGEVTIKDGDFVIAKFDSEVTIKKELDAPDKIVANPENLTDDEKTKLKEKIKEDIKAKNPGLPDDTKIVVDLENGTVEVKDKDNNVLDKFEDIITKLGNPKITQVLDLNDIEREKAEVVEKIKAIKGFPVDAKVDVVAKIDGEKKAGTVIVTVGEGENAKVIARYTPEETIVKIYINRPDITKVLDINKLTEDDKTKVKETIKKANKELTDAQIAVDDNGNATITIDGKVVKQFKQAETVSPKEVRKPDITIVKDKEALTKDEKIKVKEAIKKANPGLTDEQIVVDDNGNATITISGVESKFIPEDTVKQETNLELPSITRIYDLENLTTAEKKAVKDAIEASNTGVAMDIAVANDGTATIKVKDTIVILTPEQTVAQKEIQVPGKTVVVDKKKLTDAEKAAVKKAVEEVNPGIAEIVVNDDGSVTLNDKEILNKEQTVEQRFNEPAKTKVEDKKALTDAEKEKVKDKVVDANPNVDKESIFVDDDGAVTIGGEKVFTPEQTIKIKGGGSHSNNHGGGGGGGSYTKPSNRLSGDDRIGTAVEVSKASYSGGSNTVVIVNMEKFADVLTATPFAVHINAPILFVNKDSVPQKTMDEIRRLGATKVYIAGGEASVSKKVAEKFSNVHRFNGADRYDTAKFIAESVRVSGNKKIVEIASGETFPDALSMSALAVRDDAPILLVKKDDMTSVTRKALTEWKDVERINVAGYHATISKQVEKSLADIHKSLTFRYGGADRYETSTIIAKEARKDSRFAIYTSGEVFADALVAGPYAGKKKAPVLLVKKNEVPKVVQTYTEGSKIRDFKVVGGKEMVNRTVIEKLLKIVK